MCLFLCACELTRVQSTRTAYHYYCHATACLSRQMNHDLIGCNELSCFSLNYSWQHGRVEWWEVQDLVGRVEKSCCFNLNATYSFTMFSNVHSKMSHHVIHVMPYEPREKCSLGPMILVCGDLSCCPCCCGESGAVMSQEGG